MAIHLTPTELAREAGLERREVIEAAETFETGKIRKDALAAVDRLAAQPVRLEAQRTALAEALRHATNRYRAGYASYLEQLDAQRSLLNVELTLVQLRADQLNALVALYQAMGGGWRA